MPIIYISLTIALTLVLSASAFAAQPEPNTADPAQTAQSSASATQTEPFDKQRFQKEVIEHKDLPNFHEVHPYLLRAGAPTESGMQEVHEKGVSTIIDLRNPGEKKFDEAKRAKEMGIKYIAMPMSSKAPTKKQVDTFLKAVTYAKQHPKDGAVLVHCTHGSDRTGCLVGVWRVTEDGFNYDQAYKEMRKYWFGPKFTNLSGTVEKYAGKKVD